METYNSLAYSFSSSSSSSSLSSSSSTSSTTKLPVYIRESTVVSNIFKFMSSLDCFRFTLASSDKNTWRSYIFHEYPYLEKNLREALKAYEKGKGSTMPVFYGMLANLLRRQHRDPGASPWKKIPLEGHEKGITSIAVDPNGEFVVSGSKDSTIRVWRSDGRLTSVLDHGASKMNDTGLEGSDGEPIYTRGNPVTAIAVSPKGNFIVSGAADGIVRVWYPTWRGFKASVLGGHEGAVTSIAISSDGKLIVSGSKDHTARVWTFEGKCYWKSELLKGHTNEVFSVSFDPNGQLILTMAEHSESAIWSCDSFGKWNFKPGLFDRIPIAMDENRFIVTGCLDARKIRVLKRDQLGQVMDASIELDHPNEVGGIAIHPRAEFIATGCSDKIVRIWRETKKDEWQAASLGGCEWSSPSSERGFAIYPLIIDRYGHLIIASCDDNRLRVWHQNGTRHWTNTPAVLPCGFSRGQAMEIAIDSNSKLIATHGYDKTAQAFLLNINGWIEQATKEMSYRKLSAIRLTS